MIRYGPRLRTTKRAREENTWPLPSLTFSGVRLSAVLSQSAIMAAFVESLTLCCARDHFPESAHNFRPPPAVFN